MKTSGRRGTKLRNEYLSTLGPLYAETPKAVFAAIAVSFAARLAGHGLAGMEITTPEILNEWLLLHQNGIVPQRPPK